MKSVSKASILIVDDTRVNRMVLKTQLENEGYEVIVAEGGAEALELLPKPGSKSIDDSFDAIILDIMMPDVDGFQVLKELRKVRSSIEMPVIMATAKTESEDVVGALKSGANDYVKKPVDIPVLLARLETHLALKRSHGALRHAQYSLINAAKTETVGYLAAGVAHEIRNPLAQIQLAADGIASLKEVQASEYGAEFSAALTSAVEQADEIVLRLMEFSSSARLKLKPGNINELIEKTLKILADDVSAGEVNLSVSLDQDLKPIMISENDLQKVLINLLLNAIQAMGENKDLSITTSERLLEGLPPDEGARTGNRLRNGDEVCEIRITDCGPGIPKENLGTIFDAFFTTKATGKGTGLGLTVAKKVVELHGGMIEIRNRTDDQAGVEAIILLPTKGNTTHV